MFKCFITILMLCGMFTYANVKIFDYHDFRVYAIQDASNCFPATLFSSTAPNEQFVQSAKDYAGSVNVFIVEFKADKKRIMIDAGFGTPKGKLLAEMKKANIPPESIADILITHIHPDHIAGLPSFQNAKIHIAKDEYDAWKKSPAKKNMAKYLPKEEQLDLFAFNSEVVPKIKALNFAGHTTGHTIFQMNNCFWVGDIIHAADLQIAHPDFCASYDMNPSKATESRKKALKTLTGEWFGAHIPFPGRWSNQQTYPQKK